MSKHHRLSFGKRVNKSTRPGELIFADVCDPIGDNDLAGYRYFPGFKEDFSSFRVTYLLRRKNEVEEKLPIFIEMVNTQTQLNIVELCTDGE